MRTTTVCVEGITVDVTSYISVTAYEFTLE